LRQVIGRRSWLGHRLTTVSHHKALRGSLLWRFEAGVAARESLHPYAAVTDRLMRGMRIKRWPRAS